MAPEVGEGLDSSGFLVLCSEGNSPVWFAEWPRVIGPGGKSETSFSNRSIMAEDDSANHIDTCCQEDFFAYGRIEIAPGHAASFVANPKEPTIHSVVQAVTAVCNASLPLMRSTFNELNTETSRWSQNIIPSD